jgi:hypothetical protein
MNFSTRARKFLIAGMMALFTPVLGACGGGESESATDLSGNSGRSIGETIICDVLFVLIDGECVAQTTTTTSGGSGNPSDTWLSATAAELEPNNSLANAQPLTFPVPSNPENNVRLKMHGTVNDQDDVVDIFIVMAPDSRDYAFSLTNCTPDCDSGSRMDVFDVYFRLLDQDGNELLSTKFDMMAANSAATYLDAGVVYYASVDAVSTGGADQPYRFTASQLRK